MMTLPSHLIEKAKAIKLVISDVDGVLTDGLLFYSHDGTESKAFHVQDGLGIQLLREHGVEFAIITSRQSNSVAERMRQLQVQHVIQGQHDKQHAYEDLLKKLNLQDFEVAYIGDDLPDLPLILRVGLGITVADANALVRQQAAWVTERAGGRGAVREFTDALLSAQSKITAMLEPYQR